MQRIVIEIEEDDKLVDKLWGELRQYFVNQSNRYKLTDIGSSGEEIKGIVEDLTGKKLYLVRECHAM